MLVLVLVVVDGRWVRGVKVRVVVVVVVVAVVKCVTIVTCCAHTFVTHWFDVEMFRASVRR